jgi:hypothetical protein
MHLTVPPLKANKLCAFFSGLRFFSVVAQDSVSLAVRKISSLEEKQLILILMQPPLHYLHLAYRNRNYAAHRQIENFGKSDK